MKKILSVLALAFCINSFAQTTVTNETLKFSFTLNGNYDQHQASFDETKGTDYSIFKKDAFKEGKEVSALYNISVTAKKTEESNPMLYINKFLKDNKTKYSFYEIGTSGICSFAEYNSTEFTETKMVIAAIEKGVLYVFEITATNSTLNSDQIVLDFTQIRRSLNFITNTETE